MSLNIKGILKNSKSGTEENINKSTNLQQKSPNLSIEQSLDIALENSKHNKDLSIKKRTKNSQNEKTKKISKQLNWDEKNLRKNEAERVPRMKITEPLTPFRTNSFDSSGDSNSVFSTDDEESDFESKRKKHYSKEFVPSDFDSFNKKLSANKSLKRK
ncbi:hypothetical protein MHBO_003361 [Bonamia ostreae]|uniref:Uncharacterized protein n=1 Tax=Bonamia ostreae TaxID=126728 RepID=A0ABV2AQ73_9EUKA